jgi:hypothetical protein
MIDVENQNWMEGFVKESANYGLNPDQTKELLANATHFHMYKESEAYRDGFDKEAQRFGGLGKALKGLFGKGKAKAPKVNSPKLGPVKPLGGKAPRVPATGAGAAAAGMGAIKPIGTTAAKATGAASKAAPASGAASGASKAKSTAKADPKSTTSSQKSTTPKDTAGETAAAGAEQSKGFFSGTGSGLKTMGTLGLGGAGMYGLGKAQEGIENLSKGEDELAMQSIMEGGGSESSKMRQMQMMLKQKAQRDFNAARDTYGFGKDKGGGGRNFYGMKDIYSGAGM